jgi:hypothetical protein
MRFAIAARASAIRSSRMRLSIVSPRKKWPRLCLRESCPGRSRRPAKWVTEISGIQRIADGRCGLSYPLPPRDAKKSAESRWEARRYPIPAPNGEKPLAGSIRFTGALPCPQATSADGFALRAKRARNADSPLFPMIGKAVRTNGSRCGAGSLFASSNADHNSQSDQKQLARTNTL